MAKGKGGGKGGPGESETFVKFVQALRENGEIAAMLKQAGKLPPQIRAIIFEQMAAKMRDADEPESLIQIVDFMRDDRVFKKVIEMLDEDVP